MEKPLLAAVINDDPTFYEDVINSQHWRDAIDAEVPSIEKNKTWTLTDLSNWGKKIGVKWVYSAKLDEHGELDKCKARLVAKGYNQTYGVGYTEVFNPVARLDIVRLLIALAAQKGLTLFQLDVKSRFLHGKLNKEMYVEQQHAMRWEEKNTWFTSWIKPYMV